jgi:hypothetical protein
MKTTKEKRDYMAKYEETPVEIKKREARNLARAHAEKAGKVTKGDGLEVDHKVRLARGGSTADANTRVVPQATNRAWRKGKVGYDSGK